MEYWLSKPSVDGDLNYLYISDDVNNVAMDTPDKVLCMFFIYFEYKVAGFLVAFSHILGFECPFGSCLFFSPTSLHPLLSSSALRMPSPLSYPQNYFPLKGLCLVSWHLHYFQINTHKNWELRSMSEKDRVHLSSSPASPCMDDGYISIFTYVSSSWMIEFPLCVCATFSLLMDISSGSASLPLWTGQLRTWVSRVSSPLVMLQEQHSKFMWEF